MPSAEFTPEYEIKRLAGLLDFDLDYTDLEQSFKDLTKLAAKIAGTDISLVNLIDSYTQWSVSNYGLPIQQMPREDSVCNYTIMGNSEFEVKDLSEDERFKDKFYVVDKPNLRYYFGIPLQTTEGYNIGTLCVLDTNDKHLDDEQIELLKIIANEIVKRLKLIKITETLKQKVYELKETQKKVVHDIRGPLAGIIGLSQVIREQGTDADIQDIMEVFNIIEDGGNSILQLADEILSSEKNTDDSNLTLLTFKDKLEKLYLPQARNKNIRFNIHTTAETEHIKFSKNKLLQITGNLIANAIKFTPPGGYITVYLNLCIEEAGKTLNISVEDTGIGMEKEKINYILEGAASSTNGTAGEHGYGFGLPVVKQLVDSLSGMMSISSEPGRGARFNIALPRVQLI